MTLWEAIKTPFLNNNVKTDGLSIENPLKMMDDLSSDIDMSELVMGDNLPYNVKRKELSNSQQIDIYRKFALSAEGSVLVDEVVNEFYSGINEGLPIFDIENYDIPESLRKKIQESWDKINGLLDFRRNGSMLFRNWYVDSHLFLECIYDENKMKDGIKYIGLLDPKGLSKEYDSKTKRYVYKYEQNSGGYFTASKDKVSNYYDPEQIVYINSSLKDQNGNIISYIHPAVKIMNQMTVIEDMLVVYRITRGSEKRAIKVNVGNMPKTKAVTYITELVNKFRNKKMYNSNTGQVENNSHIVAVTEDIWLPTKNSTKDIEIDTLQGGMQLGELEDVQYFRNKLMMAMRVPSNRFGTDTDSFSITATEINRQEIRFMKFIANLRLKFNEIYIELLRRDLIATGAMNLTEFNALRTHIIIKYPGEGIFLKKEFNALLEQRLSLLEQMEQYIGKYYSEYYVKSVILEQDDELIKKMKEEMTTEEQETTSSKNFSDTFGSDFDSEEQNEG